MDRQRSLTHAPAHETLHYSDRQIGSESIARTKGTVEDPGPICAAKPACDQNVAPVDTRQLHEFLKLLQVTAGCKHYSSEDALAILSARLDTPEESDSSVCV